MNLIDLISKHPVPVTRFQRPYVIAEAGVNHEGSMDIARRLIDEAALGGADAIKFQTYKAGTLASKHSPAYWDTSKEPTPSQYELFKKHDSFWKGEFENLKKHCDQAGIAFMSTPFDVESAKFLNDMMDVFKISSSDLTNRPFIEFMCDFKKPIIMSTGAASLAEIAEAVSWIEAKGNPLALLHCVLNYPTMDENAALGRTTGNPCYEDQMEGVALFAKGRSLFLFNAILNAKHQFLRMFAGDYIAAHKEACKFVDEVYGCVIPKLADMVIVSCGGYPKDINVYQMQKTMENASCAVRKDGVVILLADCEEGSGSKVLEETFRRLKTPAAIKAELEANFKIGANKAYAITRPIEKARYILVTSLDRQLAKDMLFTGAVDTVEEALEIAKQYVGETPDMILMPEGSLTVPRVE